MDILEKIDNELNEEKVQEIVVDYEIDNLQHRVIFSHGQEKAVKIFADALKKHGGKLIKSMIRPRK